MVSNKRNVGSKQALQRSVLPISYSHILALKTVDPNELHIPSVQHRNATSHLSACSYFFSQQVSSVKMRPAPFLILLPFLLIAISSLQSLEDGRLRRYRAEIIAQSHTHPLNTTPSLSDRKCIRRLYIVSQLIW